MSVPLKTPEQLANLRIAGKILAHVHQATRAAVRPGITTGELDKLAADIIRAEHGIPTFLNYHPTGAIVPFPAVLTVSVNDEVVHGIPGKRVIHDGDLVSIDCGVTYNGMIVDAAFTMGCGEIKPEHARLIRAAEEALAAGIAQARVGNHISDISLAISSTLAEYGLEGGILREYTGHGVGESLWETPSIPNWYPRARHSHRFNNRRLLAGMVLALEPMVTLGAPKVDVLADGWTVRTVDGAWCTHVEHTIAITNDGAEILTLP